GFGVQSTKTLPPSPPTSTRTLKGGARMTAPVPSKLCPALALPGSLRLRCAERAATRMLPSFVTCTRNDCRDFASVPPLATRVRPRTLTAVLGTLTDQRLPFMSPTATVSATRRSLAFLSAGGRGSWPGFRPAENWTRSFGVVLVCWRDLPGLP